MSVSCNRGTSTATAVVLGITLAMMASQPAASRELVLGGHVSTELQIGLQGCFSAGEPCRYLDLRNTNVVGLMLQSRITQKVAVRGAVDFINLNVAGVETLDDTSNPEKIQPVHVRVQDAFVDLYGVALRKLDLRIGAQRIRWGTGDGINPTDRINPFNLEDPTAFDRRLSTIALLVAYQAGKIRFEVVGVPFFVPAALPMQETDFEIFTSSQEAFDLNEYVSGDRVVELRNIDTRVELPERTLANSAFAARILWSGTVGDLGVSFYHGRDSLPQGHGDVLLTGYASDNTSVDIKVPLIYPRLNVLGLEYRVGPPGDFTFWGEAALIFPAQTSLVASQSQLQALVDMDIIDQLPDPLPTQVTQSGRPYVQAIAGGDLVTPFGLYLNLQYSRGFPTERQGKEQGNYVLGAIRFTFPGGNLVLSNEAGLEIRDDGTVGYMISPEVSLLFGDAVSLAVGAIWLGGAQGSNFENYRGLSHFKLATAVEF